MKTIKEQVDEFSIEGWDIMLNAEAYGLYNAVRPKLLEALQERDRIAREDRLTKEMGNNFVQENYKAGYIQGHLDGLKENITGIKTPPTV